MMPSFQQVRIINEDAIRALPVSESDKLLCDIPSLFPECADEYPVLDRHAQKVDRESPV